MARKLAKTMRIFVEIEHIKNWEVTFWHKRIRQLFPDHVKVGQARTQTLDLHILLVVVLTTGPPGYNR